MPIPHQRHAGFRDRLKMIFGADCLKWVEGVDSEDFNKVKQELGNLRKETVKLREQNSRLLGQVAALQGKKAAA